MTRAPRVLVSGVVLGQPMGGVRRHNAELLPRLARLLDENGGALAILEGRTPIAFELPTSVTRIASSVRARPPILRSLAESRALRGALQDARDEGRPFDIVHTAHFPAPRSLKTPLTITVHDLRHLAAAHASMSRRALASPLIGAALKHAACIFTVSATIARQIQQRFDIASERTVVIGNGVDHLVPLARTVASDAPLVCIGHVEPRKNIELAIRALAADPSLPRLEIHGAAKGGEGERLLALAKSLGVDARVRFAGPFDDVDLPAIYARAACVVLPSTVEGFGIVALEAQRARVPLCIARAGALPEVAGPNAPSFDVDDALECARAIRTAMNASPTSIEAAAHRADAFTWDACASRWFEALCAFESWRK